MVSYSFSVGSASTPRGSVVATWNASNGVVPPSVVVRGLENPLVLLPVTDGDEFEIRERRRFEIVAVRRGFRRIL